MLYPQWLNPGDNAWQMTAATLVGLMSVPGLVVLYGRRDAEALSVNSMMLSFVAFALVLVLWVLYGFKMGFGNPVHTRGRQAQLLQQLHRQARSRAESARRSRGRGRSEPRRRGVMDFPQSSLVYFRSSSRRSRRSSCSAPSSAREHQGVDPVRRALVVVRVHGERLPHLGRRLVRAAGRR